MTIWKILFGCYCFYLCAIISVSKYHILCHFMFLICLFTLNNLKCYVIFTVYDKHRSCIVFTLFKVTYLLYKAFYVLLNFIKVIFFHFFPVLSRKKGVYPVLSAVPEKIGFGRKNPTLTARVILRWVVYGWKNKCILVGQDFAL